MMTIAREPTIYNLEYARNAATLLVALDEDKWDYQVIELDESHAKIAAYDEEGILAGYF